MEFVVDTLGNVDLTTARPLRWTHWAFRQSVMEWLPRARFIPAEIEGVKVRQLVQQPYLFKIGK